MNQNKKEAFSFAGLYVSGKVKKENERVSYNYKKSFSDFTGLAANTSLGYSPQLGSKIQTSAQLSASMPTPLAIHAKGKVYMPSFELNLGLGF